MKKKGTKNFVLSQILDIDRIASIHNQVIEWLRHRNHIDIAFKDVNKVDTSFLQWFIAFIRTAKLKPYTVAICGAIPSELISRWELIGISTPFYDFLRENQVTLSEEG